MSAAGGCGRAVTLLSAVVLTLAGCAAGSPARTVQSPARPAASNRSSQAGNVAGSQPVSDGAGTALDFTCTATADGWTLTVWDPAAGAATEIGSVDVVFTRGGTIVSKAQPWIGRTILPGYRMVLVTPGPGFTGWGGAIPECAVAFWSP